MVARRIRATLHWLASDATPGRGQNLGTIELKGGSLIAFFNPRRDKWHEHFVFRGALIEPLTPRGEVTARILRFNLDKRVAERRLLISAGRYP
jgi:hypothetical protein